MIVGHLHILNFRNIHEARLQLGDRLNVITGSNAAGKTSVLEALYFLGRGRSFRSKHVRDLIRETETRSDVFGEFSGGIERKLGIGIDPLARKLDIRLDGKSVERASELANLIPLVFAGPDAGNALFVSPGERRRLMDWGVFHVEQKARPYLERYRRSLSQRNTLLRSGLVVTSLRREIQPWDQELSICAQQIDEARCQFLDKFKLVFQRYLVALSPSFITDIGQPAPFSFRYGRGWPSGESLHTVLEAELEVDRLKGVTTRGPHRADLVPYFGQQNALLRCSHGQQKLVTAAMALAQIFLLKEDRDQPCLLLFDDLPSELDEVHRRRFLALLRESGAQSCVTTTELDLIYSPSERNIGFNAFTMFHVERGSVRPQMCE